MKAFKKKSLALVVSVALAVVCFAAVTAVSFAEEQGADPAAFTLNVYVYDNAEDAAADAEALAKGDPVTKNVTATQELYTDAQFKAVGETYDPTVVKYMGNWGKKWHVVNVAKGTSLEGILEDQDIPKAGVTKIYLTAPDKEGKVGVYTKFAYEQIYDQVGSFFPKSSAANGVVMDGAYEVPNAVIATDYVRNDLEPADEQLFGEVNGATAEGSYYMMVAPDAEGNVLNPDGTKTPIADAGGKMFCSEVSGATLLVVKQDQPLRVKGKTVKVKAKAKKTTFAASKVFAVSGAEGKVTYKKTNGPKKITVSKAGKVTVKKGLKKGKVYTVKVTAAAAGDAYYNSKAVATSFKVKVK